MNPSAPEDTRNPAEDVQRNADQNAKAPLRDRPVAHPDRPVVDPGPEEDRSSPDRGAEGPAPIRNAGPEEMRLPPKRWTRTDEEATRVSPPPIRPAPPKAAASGSGDL